MDFDELILKKFKYILRENSRNRVDRNGNSVKMLLSYDEFKFLWEPFRNDPRCFPPIHSQSLALCRFDDLGNYEIGNVRIDTFSNNSKEMIFRQTSDPIKFQRLHDLALRSQLSAVEASKSINSRKKRKEKFKEIEHQKGCKNSQYGSYWLTDGTENLKWNDSKGNWPEFFHRGRV
jgi:hypothetical protein